MWFVCLFVGGFFLLPLLMDEYICVQIENMHTLCEMNKEILSPGLLLLSELSAISAAESMPLSISTPAHHTVFKRVAFYLQVKGSKVEGGGGGGQRNSNVKFSLNACLKYFPLYREEEQNDEGTEMLPSKSIVHRTNGMGDGGLCAC